MADAPRAAGAHDFIERLEHGYQTRLGEGGARLAVGEKQLIAIARALAMRPGLILAEDPSVEFFVQMDLGSQEVWTNDRYAWAIQKWIGAGPGLGQFIFRADA